MTDFAELQTMTSAINVANGWRESGLAEPGSKERTHQDIVELALISTEVSEGIEEVRNSKPDLYYHDKYGNETSDEDDPDGNPNKPEGLRAELADVVIRAMDMADKRGWNLGADIRTKLYYNATRGYRHGGKTA